MEKESSCEHCPCSSGKAGGSEGNLDRVKSIIIKLDSSIREGIQNKTGSLASDAEIQLVDSTNLSGRCGDKVIGANVKFGDAYFHVYILDEGEPLEVVKILGPKETSVPVNGFT